MRCASSAGREQSCPVPHARLEPDLRALLAQPLYLHLFHETFRGRAEPPGGPGRGPPAGGLPGSSGAGPARHRGPSGAARPPHGRAAHPLPAGGGGGRLGRRVARAPGRRQRPAGGQARPGGGAGRRLAADAADRGPGEGAERRVTGYGFTQQRLCEQVLLRELKRQIHPRALPTADELLAWARQADGPDAGEADDFHELTGALETVTAGLALAGEGEVLAALLDLEGETVRTRLLGSALKVLGPGRPNRPRLPSMASVRATGSERDGHCPGRRTLQRNPSGSPERWLTEHGFSPVAGPGRARSASRSCAPWWRRSRGGPT